MDLYFGTRCIYCDFVVLRSRSSSSSSVEQKTPVAGAQQAAYCSWSSSSSTAPPPPPPPASPPSDDPPSTQMLRTIVDDKPHHHFSYRGLLFHMFASFPSSSPSSAVVGTHHSTRRYADSIAPCVPSHAVRGPAVKLTAEIGTQQCSLETRLAWLEPPPLRTTAAIPPGHRRAASLPAPSRPALVVSIDSDACRLGERRRAAHHSLRLRAGRGLAPAVAQA